MSRGKRKESEGEGLSEDLDLPDGSEGERSPPPPSKGVHLDAFWYKIGCFRPVESVLSLEMAQGCSEDLDHPDGSECDWVH